MYRIPSTGIYTNTEHKGLHVGLKVRTFSTQQGSLLSLLCSLLTSQIHTFGCVERLECDHTTARVKRSIRPTWAELGGGHIWTEVPQSSRKTGVTHSLFPGCPPSSVLAARRPRCLPSFSTPPSRRSAGACFHSSLCWCSFHLEMYSAPLGLGLSKARIESGLDLKKW